MTNLEYITKIALGLLIIAVLTIIIYILHNIYKKTEIITLECKKIGSLDINKHIENMKRRNPNIDEKMLRLLYFAFRAVVMGYDKYSDSVVLCESNDPDNDNEKVTINISGKKTDNVNKEILLTYEKEKSEGSPTFKDELLTFSFEDVNNENYYKLTDNDIYIISSNESVIYNLIKKSGIKFEKDLSIKMEEKNIKVVEDSNLLISPLDIMFLKYVKFFILKLNKLT